MHWFVWLVFVCTYNISSANDKTFSQYVQELSKANKLPSEESIRSSFKSNFPGCASECNIMNDCNAYIYSAKVGMCYLAGYYEESNMTSVEGTILFTKVKQQLNEECRRSKIGWEYMGTKTTTKSGRVCQKWSSTIPHWHTLSASMANQSNFCRNPDNDSGGLWCYTTDIFYRWEYCDIPYCSTPARECLLSTRGDTYFGSVSKTADGKNCQRWDRQTPHLHEYTFLPEQNNHCRNPLNISSAPWCFTTDTTEVWNYCNITQCL